MTLDANHEELSRILEELLVADVDVSAREVARRHSSLKNASAFTRHKERADLIEQAKRRQVDARNVRGVPSAQKTASLAEQLAAKSVRVEALEQQVSQLVASHIACVRAVMQHGGVQSLQRFWKEYRQIGETLDKLNAIPSGAHVVPLERSKQSAAD